MRTGTIDRHSFGKLSAPVDLPNLLAVQLHSYESFLQAMVAPSKRVNQGLQAVFQEIFPVTDVHGNFTLEFIDYTIGQPKYSVDECKDRNMTYAASLKARLRLIIRDSEGDEKRVKDIIEQSTYLGELPLITDRGTFIVNGAERVIVTQLHRSPGVFFDETIHPNGKRLYSARIIPFRGSWLEFSHDVSDVMYVHIDRRRKQPVTVLLRAIGFSSNEEILNLFYKNEKIKVDEKAVGRTLAEPAIDTDTGEILKEAGESIDDDALLFLVDHKIKKIAVIVSDDTRREAPVIENALAKDPTRSTEEALYRIYGLLRPGDPPNVETARQLLERLFFNPKRYDLGEVGRYRMNTRLKLDIPIDQRILDTTDFIAIISELLRLRNAQGEVDDIDHLGNRRARTVGELLSNQFSVGLSRMARTIKERMSLRDTESLTPQELVNARTVSAVINAFFGSSQLSQFMDQTNPLAELTHKRRLSALGPGGLTRERAGFEVRDVHHTHYGRICPIETPEGPNIGLISSLATYARINPFGFIETPYRKVENGKVTEEIEYLTADQEDPFIVAQANAPLDRYGRFVNEFIKARVRDDYPIVSPGEVQYMDVSPTQLVSVAAGLIPFLEHDDANRALMGSNMQRQAVPLLRPDAPLVGTGMEARAARDSGAVVVAKEAGTVTKVTADVILIKRSASKARGFNVSEIDEYRLVKFKRTNQNTSINQKPLVRAGDKVKAGEVIADGMATEGGELALGKNVLVAFMPWMGYNFEDAIVVSERLVREDVYTSVHIEEYEIQVRDTRRGPEEITREIPNVGESAIRNLDELGIVRLGALVEAGDVLVGKVTPKGETELSPEERLLRAIFGEKAGDVKDASLKAPPGMNGIVIDTKIFSRKERDDKTKKDDVKQVDQTEDRFERRRSMLQKDRDAFIRDLLLNTPVGDIRTVGSNRVKVQKGKWTKDVLSGFLFDHKEVYAVDDQWTDDAKINKQIREAIILCSQMLEELDERETLEIDKIQRGDELPPGVNQLVKVFIARRRKLAVGDKMAGRHGNKGVVSKIVPYEDMPYLEDGTPVDMVLNPLGVPSRMNIGQVLEAHLGLAAAAADQHVATPVFAGAKLEEIRDWLKKGDLPTSGKTDVWDGRTGEKIQHKVTIGYVYMMKLSHLVDDKIHARSIGPYSLVTQQPLGGKAQFGGQRFGEMEVWALEAYGAAYTLQEILTFKSDDVAGRSRIYESIVKGENPPEPGVPESFNVLVKELNSLGLDVLIHSDNGEETN
ncbi:DNA-directed RNA polymerase subunit beta [Candidatus Zixiibacteriota bacterium]